MAMTARTQRSEAAPAASMQHSSSGDIQPPIAQGVLHRFPYPQFPVLPLSTLSDSVPNGSTTAAVPASGGANVVQKLPSGYPQHAVFLAPSRSSNDNVQSHSGQAPIVSHNAPALPFMDHHGMPASAAAAHHSFHPPSFYSSNGLAQAADPRTSLPHTVLPLASPFSGNHATPYSPASMPGSIPRHNTPSKSPMQAHATSPAQTVQRQSRLPPHGVARKAPRKSQPMQPMERVLGDTSRVQKEDKGRAGSQPRRQSKANSRVKEVIERELDEGTPKQANVARRNATPASRNSPAASARGRRVALDDSEESDGSEDEISLQVRQSIEDTGRNPTSGRRRGRPPKKQQSRPLIVDEKTIPPEVKSIRLALGRDNWNQYIEALEKRCMDQITEDEYKRATRANFMMFDDNMRDRMDMQVEDSVIRPRLVRMLEEQEREDSIQIIE